LYGEEYTREHTRFTRLLERVERSMLAHAVDGVITQNSFRAEIYRQERRSRVEPAVVHNYKPRWEGEDSGELKRRLGVEDSRRVVLYEGVLQQGRCLENLFRAVPLFPENTILAVIGRQRDYFKAVLGPLAASVAPDAIKFIPGVPHDELLRLVAGADAGFVVYEDRSRNNRFCAPGKLSDYVNAGIPVVASALPPLIPIVEGYGIGACFDNDSPASIAAAVAKVLSRSKKDWQPALRDAQRHLVWETQEPALREAVLGLLECDVRV
jgi:glycosyltransferase involved in cell wall biosynthesis